MTIILKCCPEISAINASEHSGALLHAYRSSAVLLGRLHSEVSSKQYSIFTFHVYSPASYAKALAGGLSNIVGSGAWWMRQRASKVISSKYAAKPRVVTPGFATIRIAKYLGRKTSLSRFRWDSHDERFNLQWYRFVF